MPGQVPMPNLTALSNPYGALQGANSPGRPVKVTPTVMAPANTPTGFSFAGNVTPEAVQQAQQKYLSAHQLPPALQPKLATAITNRRNRAISRGWSDRITNPANRG